MEEVPRDRWKDLPDSKNVIKVFFSDKFLVQVIKQDDAIRLTINKVNLQSILDGKPIWEDGITWDELQEIKNQCGYENYWLCEYFPPKDKLVNVANMRHLWVMEHEPESSLERPRK